MRYRMLFSYCLVITVCGFWVNNLSGQEQNGVRATPLQSESTCSEEEDGLRCRTTFILEDSEGNPLPDLQPLTAVEGILNGKDGFSGTIKPVSSDMTVTFLLDMSGSISSVEEEVRAAAIGGLARVPTGAKIGVGVFNSPNEDGSVVRWLTDGFVFESSTAVATLETYADPPAGGTCLYDAAYEAIERMHSVAQNQLSRSILIVLTDGKDQIEDGVSCSQRSIDEVINLAAGPKPTQINAIGLGEDISREGLERLAKETFGLANFGEITELSNIFNKTVDGIRSQWGIDILLKPPTGNKQPIDYVVTTTAGDLLLKSEISSTINYSPIKLTIDNFQYIPREQDGTHGARFLIESSSPLTNSLDIEIEIVDERNVQAVRMVKPFGESNYFIDFPTHLSGDYLVLISALSTVPYRDIVGSRQMVNVPDPIPPTPTPTPVPEPDPQITITGVDRSNGQICIDPLVTHPEKIEIYEFSVIDSGNNTVVKPEAKPWDSQTICAQFDEPKGEYTAVLTFTSTNGQKFGPVTSTFTHKDCWRWLRALAENKLISGAIVGTLILGSILYLFYSNRLQLPPVNRKRGRNGNNSKIGPKSGVTVGPSSRRRAIPKNIRSRSQAMGPVSVALRVLFSDPAIDPAKEFSIDKFPFTLGRESTDFIIQGAGVSRLHAQIDRDGRKIRIRDLDSSNGTYLNDEQVESSVTLFIEDLPAKIGLGQETQLLLTAKGDSNRTQLDSWGPNLTRLES